MSLTPDQILRAGPSRISGGGRTAARDRGRHPGINGPSQGSLAPFPFDQLARAGQQGNLPAESPDWLLPRPTVHLPAGGNLTHGVGRRLVRRFPELLQQRKHTVAHSGPADRATGCGDVPGEMDRGGPSGSLTKYSSLTKTLNYFILETRRTGEHNRSR